MSPVFSDRVTGPTCRISPSSMVGNMLRPRAQKPNEFPFAIRSREKNPKIADWLRCSIMKIKHGVHRCTVGNKVQFVAGDDIQRPVDELERAIESRRTVEGRKTA